MKMVETYQSEQLSKTTTTLTKVFQKLQLTNSGSDNKIAYYNYGKPIMPLRSRSHRKVKVSFCSVQDCFNLHTGSSTLG
jgi:hypothetical protein